MDKKVATEKWKIYYSTRVEKKLFFLNVHCPGMGDKINIFFYFYTMLKQKNERRIIGIEIWKK